MSNPLPSSKTHELERTHIFTHIVHLYNLFVRQFV